MTTVCQQERLLSDRTGKCFFHDSPAFPFERQIGPVHIGEEAVSTGSLGHARTAQPEPLKHYRCCKVSQTFEKPTICRRYPQFFDLESRGILDKRSVACK